MIANSSLLLHATCVCWQDIGILLRGPSGAGKSDLALRLIDQGAELVADDQVRLSPSGELLLAEPPETLAGLIEVRGLGVVRMPHLAKAAVGLVVELVPLDEVERMPDQALVSLLDHSLPLCRLSAFEAAATTKVRLAVRQATGSIMTLR